MRQSFRATRGGRGKNAGKGFAVLTRGDLLEDPVGAEVEEAVGVEAGAVHGHRVLQDVNLVAVTHSRNLFQQTT